MERWTKNQNIFGRMLIKGDYVYAEIDSTQACGLTATVYSLTVLWREEEHTGGNIPAGFPGNIPGVLWSHSSCPGNPRLGGKW